MALTHKHLQDICLQGQGHASCRYLSYDATLNVHYCAKLNPQLKSVKDDAVRYSEKEAKRLALPVVDYFNLYDLGHGDNCNGYLALKHIPQGYDLP